MEAKNAAFQRLKPTCVALSQAALGLNGSQGDTKAVTHHLEHLKEILISICSKQPVLDAKLAEYVFFPISQVLKASKRASIRILELSLQCVAILVDQGWKQNIPSQLAVQIVILCSLLGEKAPKGLSFAESTDELQTSSFRCLYHIFATVERGSEVSKLLTSLAKFPQLGQTISVLLDGIEEGRSNEVQISGTIAMERLVSNVLNRETQASFLPGIVSKLTRVLMPQTKSRRNHKVIMDCLSILETLIESTLSDHQLLQASEGNGRSVNSNSHHQDENTIITEKWREEAAVQLKPAIAKITKLNVHDRNDVRDSLGRLCLMLLKRCSKSLATCSQKALETLITICAADPDLEVNTELTILISTSVRTSELLQISVYDRLQSLPTTMQGADDHAKTLRIQQITMAYELLVQAGVQTSEIDRLLAATLRDSVFLTLALPELNEKYPSDPPSIQSMALTVSNEIENSHQFDSPLVRFKGQEGPMAGIEHFTKLISSTPTSSAFAADLARDLLQSSGGTQIANFWLLLTAIQNASQRKDDLDDLLNLEPRAFSVYDECLEELYSFSLSVLTEPSDKQLDPRLQALALRTLALRAQSAQKDFRYELIDALYPVLHTLATPNETLQRDSLTTLNIFTSCCGYGSVKDLIVENIDYLTNAVALKLNAFDVSPQAPQVLLTMVRLAGSGLLPYLGDTVESIFAALEDYHGYPLLVELLFEVLRVIAEEGVKAPQLQITAENTAVLNDILVERWRPTTMSVLANLIEEYVREDFERLRIEDDELEEHPKRPWKDIQEEVKPDADTESIGQDQQIGETDSNPPATKTYTVVFKITELTQHFLPSASPSLRASLLSLIGITVPAIARHENSFLPLINTLWPEIVSRLDDNEPFIVAKSLDVIGLLCTHARDFMRTRVVQLWPKLDEIYQTASKGIAPSNASRSSRVESVLQLNNPIGQSKTRDTLALATLKTASGGYSDTSATLLWSSLKKCLLSIVQFVPITPQMVDEALKILEPALDEVEVQQVFAEENSDILWLAQLKNGALSAPVMPEIPENTQWRFAQVPR